MMKEHEMQPREWEHTRKEAASFFSATNEISTRSRRTRCIVWHTHSQPTMAAMSDIARQTDERNNTWTLDCGVYMLSLCRSKPFIIHSENVNSLHFIDNYFLCFFVRLPSHRIHFNFTATSLWILYTRSKQFSLCCRRRRRVCIFFISLVRRR